MGIDFTYLSRLQFALTSMFHILWPVHVIGMSIFLVLVEAVWLRTKDGDYYRHARFWGRLFLLNVAMGVVTGIPLEFEFGTNWSVFSGGGADFFGNMLGFEAAMAFMLEASFLGVMLFGWGRVGAGMHLFATVMVAFGATLSAFWIMVANSWMQTPAGGIFEKGRFVIESHLAAIFNPNMPWGVSHMWVASLQISLFVVGGVSAWYLLGKREERLFLKSFKMAVIAAVVITPLQIYLGDGSGRSTYLYQPAKLAAMESTWQTNRPGEGAPWHIVAWPDPAHGRNFWSLDMPYGLSLIATHSPTGRVKGLTDFPEDGRPPILLPFYGFRIMIAVGGFSFLLALWSLRSWYKKRLTLEKVSGQKGLLYAWMAALPLNYLAMETGWVTREVGRQPYVVYGVMKTSGAASPLPAATAGASLLVFALVYLMLFVTFLVLAAIIVKRGPISSDAAGGIV
ncbi:MAG: cytochrome ubiquinol oxidase subunit I [Syntrophorhabdales bacterium]|jgi:cytochrome d ubiquinol oxidase subunit I